MSKSEDTCSCSCQNMASEVAQGPKVLNLKTADPKLETQYTVQMNIPGKKGIKDILSAVPHYIRSDDIFKFDYGVLRGTSHGMFLTIFEKESTSVVVGLYIKVPTKLDSCFTIEKVQGIFQEGTGTPSEFMAMTRCRSQCQHSRNNQLIRCTHGSGPISHYSPSINTGTGANDIPTFQSFICLQSDKPKDDNQFGLKGYLYYEAKFQNWPSENSTLFILAKICKFSYTMIVKDDKANIVERPRMLDGRNYYLSDVFSDVSLKVGTKLIPAHRIILSYNCEFFSKMFSSDMKESHEDVVEIKEVEEEVFQELLHFLYIGVVEKIDEFDVDLWFIGDRFGVDDLMAYLENHFISKLTVDNAIEMYDISQEVAYKGELAQKSKEVIMWNKDVFSSELELFKAFFQKYPELVFELLQIS